MRDVGGVARSVEAFIGEYRKRGHRILVRDLLLERGVTSPVSDTGNRQLLQDGSALVVGTGEGISRHRASRYPGASCVSDATDRQDRGDRHRAHQSDIRSGIKVPPL